jgi:hypothetical protein
MHSDRKKAFTLLFVGLSVLSMEPAAAQSVAVNTIVAWNPAATHSGSPGMDLNTPYTNTMGDYTLTMRGGGWGSTWHVDVRITLPAGSPSFVLEVQRDPANTRVIGGTTWVTIGTANTYFFSSNARNNINNLPIQYRLSNVTAGDSNIKTGSLPVTITYTIVQSLTHPP